MCLLYLETSWEKEVWCEVLRVTAKMGSTSKDWYLKTKRGYAEYTHNVEKYKLYMTEFHTDKGKTILTFDSMTRNPTKTSLMIMASQGSGLFGIS